MPKTADSCQYIFYEKDTELRGLHLAGLQDMGSKILGLVPFLTIN
jgi:hypothetical protein